MPLRLYNTLTRRLEPVAPADPASITFYTCGPTVYDDAHIGNFRSFLAADLLRRWLESPLCTLENDPPDFNGPRTVRHVMNITDVGHMTDDDLADGGGDDKMEAAAKRLQKQQLEAKKAGTAHADASAIDNPNDPKQIADFYTARFLEDARRLGLKVAIEAETDPARMPRASDYVEHMKRMIETLAEKGFAYRVGDAVYFDVQKYNAYGELSGNTLDKLKGGAGGRVDDTHQADKRHPADFLLWKSDPAHLMKWPGPVIPSENGEGSAMPEGYPGWHIECSAMARHLLGDTIDLHSGGEDNIFPHHECERAQSCCATGTDNPSDTFARHWFHPRFLMVEGKKMSKSTGNFFTPRDLFAKGHDPAAVRLELIKTHYRSNANFTEQGLESSKRSVLRWRRKAHAAHFCLAHAPKIAHPHWFDIESLDDRLEEFADALSSDLNISAAIAAVEMLGSVGHTVKHVDEVPDVDTPSRKIYDEIFPSRDVFKVPDRPMDQEDLQLLLHGDNPYGRVVAAFHLIDNVLGVIFTPQPKQTQTDIGVFTAGLEPDPAVIDKLVARRDAKKAKDFAAADAIRDELAAMGYAIKDIAGGKVEVSPA